MQEGIKWTQIQYFNNKVVCDLIENKLVSGRLPSRTLPWEPKHWGGLGGAGCYWGGGQEPALGELQLHVLHPRCISVQSSFELHGAPEHSQVQDWALPSALSHPWLCLPSPRTLPGS